MEGRPTRQCTSNDIFAAHMAVSQNPGPATRVFRLCKCEALSYIAKRGSSQEHHQVIQAQLDSCAAALYSSAN